MNKFFKILGKVAIGYLVLDTMARGATFLFFFSRNFFID